MFGLIDSVARRLVRRGLRQGVLEGNALWLVIAAVAWLVRLLLRPDKEQVIRERLRVGESITVVHQPAPGRTTRRSRRSRRAPSADT